VSALWVMRQLARQRPDSSGMPVVFTCALGLPQQEFLSSQSCFRPQWGISQAPQIWLDHQVYESQGELCFNWDAVQALFAPDVLCAMFDQYVALLERLTHDANAWELSLQELIVRPSLPNHALVLQPAAREVIPGLSNTALVALICSHFENVVGLPIVADRSFFDAGASSLKLLQLHQNLQLAGFGSLAIADLLTHGSPEALALHLTMQLGLQAVVVDIAGQQAVQQLLNRQNLQQQPQHTMRRHGRTGHLGRGGRGRRNARSGPGGNGVIRGGESA
jgi:yersiniabactin nonribosomal peptide synthetase